MNRSLLPLPSNLQSGGPSSLSFAVSHQENRWSWVTHRTKSNFFEIWLRFWQTVRYCRNFEFVARFIRNSRITGNNQFDPAKMVRSIRVVTMCSIHCIHRTLLERVFHFFFTHFVVVKSKKQTRERATWDPNLKQSLLTIFTCRPFLTIIVGSVISALQRRDSFPISTFSGKRPL